MLRRPRRGVPALLLAAALLAVALPAAAATVPVPESIRAQNIPPLDAGQLGHLLPYENLRFAHFQDWHPSQRRILLSTRFAETGQLHEVAMPMGARTQITFYGERVFGGAYRPGHPSQIVFSYDEGGAENYQIFLLDRDTGRARRLSDGVHRYSGTRWSRDGRLLAYVANSRNGRDFDLYVQDPDRPSSERRVAQLEGAWVPYDWSPDSGHLLLGHYVSANESEVYSVEVASGRLERVSPAPAAGEKVAWRGGRWSADGRSVYTATDAGSEFLRLVRLDLDTATRTVLTPGLDWDVENFDLSDDGSLLAFFSNEDGVSRLHLLDAASGGELPAPGLPDGVAERVAFRPGSREVAFTLAWARSPSDVYSYDPESRHMERWTESEAGGLPTGRFVTPALIHYPTFDESAPGVRRTIPAFVYRPDPRRFPGRRPVYINIHGGPEGQSRPGFLGSTNYLPDELGVAVIYPNVRGSSGYGKSYLLLDNGPRREDSVRDIGALLDWIAAQPDLDPSRVMVGGGSYGGYMSLATMVHYSDRLRAGFDYVGISNFVTFLEHTQEYRRDLRRVEYGDERDPEMKKLLESISPANHAAAITRPLLVAQGANDPRVPLSESDQIVREVESRGTPVWYIVARDEGHGFQKKSNADYLRAAWIAFVERYLLGRGAPAPEGGAAPSP